MNTWRELWYFVWRGLLILAFALLMARCLGWFG